MADMGTRGMLCEDARRGRGGVYKPGRLDIATKSPEGSREAWNRVPQSPQKEPALLTPCSWTSSLNNYERIHFYCLSHPVGAIFL